MVEIALHWTLDHAYHHGAEGLFPEALWRALCAADEGCCFTVLPNYWRGYGQPGDGFTFGTLRIDRVDHDGGYGYSIRHRQEASGEDLRLVYHGGAEAHRPLSGSWSISTGNDAGDGYVGLCSEGCLVEEATGRRLQLTIDECLCITGPLLPKACEPTPQWSLFDCLGDLIDAGVHHVDLLEDGEKPRLGGQLLPLEDWRFVHAGRSHRLRGYCLQGPAQVPSYWWLDECGRVLLVASTFSTYVRRGGLS